MVVVYPAAQFVVVSALLLGAYRLRSVLGLSAVVAVVASMQFLQAILGASFYWELGGVVYSPGSAVFFVSNLAIVLWAFARHGAGAGRRLVYAVLIGNAVPFILSTMIQLQLSGTAPVGPGDVPDTVFRTAGTSAAVGVVLLYIDQLVAILSFTWLQHHTPFPDWLKFTMALLVGVAIDTVGYLGVLFGGAPQFGALLADGLISKSTGGLVFGLVWGSLLHWVPRTTQGSVRGIFDVMLFRESVEDLKRAAATDALTGVYNRRRLDQIVGDYFDANPGADGTWALALVDIDHFKHVNDTVGHAEGDEILIDVADWLQEAVRDGDRVFRIGGDEFAVLLDDCDAHGARSFAGRVEDFARPYAGDGGTVTVSTGLAIFPNDARDWESLFDTADRRLYEAKESGRARASGPWSGGG